MSTIGQFAQPSAGMSAGVGAGATSGGQGDTSTVEAAIRSFAVMMAEELLLGTNSSQAQAIAKKLPGASENVTAQMQTLREENQLVSDRREIGKMMSRKDEAMAFRD